MSNTNVLAYSLQPYSINQHLFKVVINVPLHTKESIHLSMPAWIPGSYMIRDFAKNVCELRAQSGSNNSLAVTKLDKQVWQVTTNGEPCEITYLVYAFDLSVRSAYLNDEYGFINGTSAFLEVKEFANMPCRLDIPAPIDPQQANWRVVTGMPKETIDNSCYGHYRAENYASFIDFPILFGHFVETQFTQGGINFKLVFTGNMRIDIERIASDLKPILQQHIALFEETPPINDYLFITLLTQNGYGGLEHKNSTALMYSRWDLPIISDPVEKTQPYIDFLALCSHEFLHTWHVKRTRPKVFLAPNLGEEVYTNQLWIYEGFTSFYDDLALARANTITPIQYLQIIGKNITRLLRNTGRLKQSAAESSFDAWTRFYQQDANSINHIVSYYTKGSLIALCLDIYIRENSDNQYSLDDVMRNLWQVFGKGEIGTDDDVIVAIVNQFTGKDVQPLLNQWVYSPGDLPLASMLRYIGVEYHERFSGSLTDLGGTALTDKTLLPFGLNVKPSEVGLVVTQVREASIAGATGIQVNDRLIALDDWQVTESNLPRLIATIELGQSASIHLLRDGRLIRCEVNLQSVPFDACFLTIENEVRLNKWLGRQSD